MGKCFDEKIAIENINENMNRYNPDIHTSGYKEAAYTYKTLVWYEKAAENGDASVANTLGYLYYRGEEREPYYEKAFYWKKKAAENGHIGSFVSVGYMYEHGEGGGAGCRKSHCMVRNRGGIWLKRSAI